MAKHLARFITKSILLYPWIFISMLACDTKLRVDTVSKEGSCESEKSKKFPDRAKLKKYCENIGVSPSESQLTIITKPFTTNTNQVEMRWTGRAFENGYRIGVFKDKSCENSYLSYNHTDSYKQMTITEDGEYFFCVFGLNSQGFETKATNNGVPFTIDTVAPYIASDVNFPDSIAEPTIITLDVNDSSDLSYEWKKLSGPGDLFVVGAGNSPTITATIPGTYTVRVTITDAAGNPTEKTYSFE
tara:strand:+ start:1412 stop:2143 length:732 start_codon:yes stop_codon:yes gene_type:complete